jgi:hypothetical protein
MSPPILKLLGLCHRSIEAALEFTVLYKVASVISTKKCLRTLENLGFTGRKTLLCLGTEEIFVIFLVNLVFREPLKAFLKLLKSPLWSVKEL